MDQQEQEIILGVKSALSHAVDHLHAGGRRGRLLLRHRGRQGSTRELRHAAAGPRCPRPSCRHHRRGRHPTALGGHHPDQPAGPIRLPPSVPLHHRDQLWGVDDVAGYLGVPVKTLYQWRHQGYGPKSRRVGRYVRYSPRDVIAWFEQLDDAN